MLWVRMAEKLPLPERQRFEVGGRENCEKRSKADQYCDGEGDSNESALPAKSKWMKREVPTATYCLHILPRPQNPLFKCAFVGCAFGRMRRYFSKNI